MLINFDLPELGYTPKNLKYIKEKYQLTNQQIADLTDTKLENTVQRWQRELDSPTHADMPLWKWRLLLDHLMQSDCNKS